MAVQDDSLFDPEVQHSLVRKIPNKSTKTKARASLPDILYLKEIYGKVGVFTTNSLAKATQFGPLEAPLATKNQMDEPTFLMKLDIRKCRRLESSASSYIYYDTTDENMCNWMMLVQPANMYSEQNLCAYQNEDFVYFTTTREIQADEELKVWYSPTYAKFMSAGVLTPTTSGLVNIPKVNPGKQKSKQSKSTRRMQVYPNSLILERDVRSIPPKKRGWKRTKRMDTELPCTGGLATPGCAMRHQSAKQKRSICEICKKTFKDSTKLRIHSVVHSSARNFLCHRCGATFKRQDKLREHEKRSHEAYYKPVKPTTESQESLEKYPFKCDKCQIGFQRRGMLINHIMKRHPGTHIEEIEELNRPVYKLVRKFQCPYCEKAYQSNTKRKSHVRKHHPALPLPVNLKRRRGEKIDLKDLNIISEKPVLTRPFGCSYCTMEYSMKHKLEKHMKEKHAEFFKGDTRKRKKKQTLSTEKAEDTTPHENASTLNILLQPTEIIQCPNAIPTNPLVQEVPTSTHVPDQTSSIILPQVQQSINTNSTIDNTPQPNQNVMFSYNNAYDGLLNDQLLTGETVSIPAGFEVCRTLDPTTPSSNLCISNTPQTVPELFGNGNNTVGSLPSELPAEQFLAADLQTIDPTGVTQQQTQQHYTQSGPSRSYHYGRKRILRDYEDSQNQLMQSQSGAEQQYSSRSRQMPYKVRLLNHETSNTQQWMCQHRSDISADSATPSINDALYLHLNNERSHQCAVRSNATLDPMLVDNQRVQMVRADWNENDISRLLPL